MRKVETVAVMVLALAACGDNLGRDEGYEDGYAVGYNTACEIRTTMIHGAFDNTEYAKGYAAGVTDGVKACNSDRAAGRSR